MFYTVIITECILHTYKTWLEVERKVDNNIFAYGVLWKCGYFRFSMVYFVKICQSIYVKVALFQSSCLFVGLYILDNLKLKTVDYMLK